MRSTCRNHRRRLAAAIRSTVAVPSPVALGIALALCLSPVADAQGAEGIAAVSLNLTSRDETPDAWIAASWRNAFCRNRKPGGLP